MKINKKPTKQASQALIKRLTTNNDNNPLYHLKMKFPSSKIIKREDQYSHRLKYRKYIPSEKFHYQPSLQKTIDNINKVKLSKVHSTTFHRQLTGGPKENKDYITIDLHRKKIQMTSTKCLKAIIMIQAKWKAVFYKKKFGLVINQIREKMNKQFEQKVISLSKIYPVNKKINMKAIQSRLRRVNMQIDNILKPYVRTVKKASNSYTSFCVSKLTLGELKNKHSRNGFIRRAEFGKMVEENQYNLLLRSGIVVTNKQINQNFLKKGANAIWWAVYHSNIELTRTFLSGGGDPNSKDNEDNTCLHIAMRNGDVQIIFELLDYGADLNRKNNKKVTALHYATNKMLKLLGLQEGHTTANLNQTFVRDNNSLFFRNGINLDDIYHQSYY